MQIILWLTLDSGGICSSKKYILVKENEKCLSKGYIITEPFYYNPGNLLFPDINR